MIFSIFLHLINSQPNIICKAIYLAKLVRIKLILMKITQKLFIRSANCQHDYIFEKILMFHFPFVPLTSAEVGEVECEVIEFLNEGIVEKCHTVRINSIHWLRHYT